MSWKELLIKYMLWVYICVGPLKNHGEYAIFQSWLDALLCQTSTWTFTFFDGISAHPVYSLLGRLNKGIFLSFLLNMFSTRGKEWQLIYPSEAFQPRSADYPCFKRHSREDPRQEVVFQPNTAPSPPNTKYSFAETWKSIPWTTKKILKQQGRFYRRKMNLNILQTTKTFDYNQKLCVSYTLDI